ncbi:POK10 protein, partial [Leptocoma aspasia]|nr:POK10 protein [Leptocoma aspasia]
RDVIKHMLRAIATLGVPEVVKTDNGSAYVSQSMKTFLHSWGTRHLTGIPHSSRGQAVVECTHAL